MKNRLHDFSKKLVSLLLICALFAGNLFAFPVLSTHAAEVTAEAATQITASNLSNYADQGITEAHIGYYAISTVGNLFWYAEQVDEEEGNNTALNAVLTNDITIQTGVLVDGELASDTSGFTVWTPICNEDYTGTLDGNGHVIRGLFNNTRYSPPCTTNSYNGLFALADATIRNLGIEDSYFGHSSSYSVASFIGIAGYKSVIENCYSTAAIVGSHYCGGIVGEAFGTIRNCWFGGTIDAYDELSAAITSDYRYEENTVENCYYLDDCGLNSVCATAVTADDVRSGLLTYRLNAGVTDGTQRWYQTVGAGQPAFSGAVVYASQPCPVTLGNAPVSETHEHSFSTAWSVNDSEHWHICSACYAEKDRAEHTPDVDGLCECQYQMSACVISSDGDATYYPNIDDADPAAGDGDILKLLADNEDTISFTWEAGVTLDLNGFEHSGYTEVYYDTTIIDSSAEKTGKVTYRLDVSNYFEETPTLTVKGGIFEGATLDIDSDCTLIVMNSVVTESEINNNGTVQIKNMTVTDELIVYGSTLEETLSDRAAVYDEDGNVVTLTDGQTELAGAFRIRSKIVSVTVGSETTEYFTLSEAFTAANAADGATVKLLDDFDADGESYSVTGKVALDLNGKILSNLSLYATEQNGNVGHLVIADDSAEQTGAFYGVRGLASLVVEKGATLEILSGIIDSNDIVYRNENNANSELYIKGGSIYGSIDVEETAKTVSITGGTFPEFGIYFSDGALSDNVSISGGSFEDGIYVDTYTLGDILAETYYPLAEDGYIGDLSGSEDTYCGFSFTVKEHFHDYTATYAYDTQFHWRACECGLTDGEPIREAHTGGENTCTEGAVCTTCDYEYGEATGHSYDADGVCSCDSVAPFLVTGDDQQSKFFETAKEAFAAAQEMERATIKVNLDVTEVGNEINLRDCDITVDLNGYALELEEINVYDSKLTITDTSESGEGTFYEETTLDVYGGGILILEAGIFMANVDLEDEDVASKMVIGEKATVMDASIEVKEGGALTINGGTLEETELELDGGSLTVYDGDFHITVCLYNYEKISILGGTFLIEYIEGGNFGDLFGELACVSLADQNGDAVTITPDMTESETVFVVNHDETKHDDATLEWNHDEEFHWQEYPCGSVSGEKAAHAGGTATCEALAECETCGSAYGTRLPHSFDADGKCEKCGAVAIVRIEGDGETVLVAEPEVVFEMIRDLKKVTLTLLRDSDIGEPSEIRLTDADITLDLAGYQLTNVYFTLTDGTFILNDSSKNGTGLIADSEYTSGVAENWDYYFLTLNGDSKLTVNGGTVALPIELNDDTVATVNGGTFLGYYGIDLYDSSVLTVHGGSFRCDEEEFYFGSNSSTLFLKGGVFPSGLTVDYGDLAALLTSECYCYQDANGNTVTIKKGLESYNGYLSVHDSGVYRSNYDDTHHWEECTACGDKRNVEAHSGGTATCTEKAICEVCDLAYGKALGHLYTAATCTAPKTCLRDGCGATEGDPAHIYDHACDSKCNVCGAERTVGDHADGNGDGVCDECGAKLPKEEGLSVGVIVAIVAGSVAVVGLGAFFIIRFAIKKKPKVSDAEEENEAE